MILRFLWRRSASVRDLENARKMPFLCKRGSATVNRRRVERNIWNINLVGHTISNNKIIKYKKNLKTFMLLKRKILQGCTSDGRAHSRSKKKYLIIITAPAHDEEEDLNNKQLISNWVWTTLNSTLWLYALTFSRIKISSLTFFQTTDYVSLIWQKNFICVYSIQPVVFLMLFSTILRACFDILSWCELKSERRST